MTDQPLVAAPSNPNTRAAAPARAERARSSWVDVAKGILIILVVLGHLIGGLSTSGLLGTSRFWVQAYYWIYAFHMPAFVLLAGLFLERSLRVGFTAFAVEKFKSLYYPAVLWGAIFWVLLMAAQRYANSKPNYMMLLQPLYNPVGSYWFLITLLYLSLAYAALRTVGVPRWLVCAAAIIGAGAAECFGDTWPIVVAHLTWYMGWLMLGVLLSDAMRVRAIASKRVPSWVLAGACVAGFAAMTVQIPRQMTGPPPFRAEWAVPGTIAVLCLSVLISRLGENDARAPKAFLARWLALFGRRSLPIYLMSGIGSVGARTLFTRILHIDNMWILLAGGMLAGIALPLIFAWACERVGFEYAFRWGPKEPAEPRRNALAP